MAKRRLAQNINMTNLFNIENRVCRATVAVLCCVLPIVANAEADYPNRNLKIIAPVQPGSLERPMSMAQLEAKVDGLVVPVLGAEKSDTLTEICWRLAKESDVSALVGHAIP